MMKRNMRAISFQLSLLVLCILFCFPLTNTSAAKKPPPVPLLTGNVYDADTLLPLYEATVILTEVSTGNEFLFSTDIGGDYTVMTEDIALGDYFLNAKEYQYTDSNFVFVTLDGNTVSADIGLTAYPGRGVDRSPIKISKNVYSFSVPLGGVPSGIIFAESTIQFSSDVAGISVDFDVNGLGTDYTDTRIQSEFPLVLYDNNAPANNWDPVDIQDGIFSGVIYSTSAPELVALHVDAENFMPLECGAVEICDDLLDNDCDGANNLNDPDCYTEICDNGIDDDGDGQIDLDDPDCNAFPDPPEDICNDDFDNDFDGLVDCADPDCSDLDGCGTENDPPTCDDEFDNDGDGLTDCDDPDCYNTLMDFCSNIEICDNVIDDDGDGYIDRDDSDCDAFPDPPENICNDNFDNDFDGLVDCEDPDCISDTESCMPGVPEGFKETCSDGIDNDFDGLTDCDDPGCDKNKSCK